MKDYNTPNDAPIVTQTKIGESGEQITTCTQGETVLSTVTRWDNGDVVRVYGDNRISAVGGRIELEGPAFQDLSLLEQLNVAQDLITQNRSTDN